MDAIKALLCKIFGHKYKKVNSPDIYTEIWKCSRCGDERRIAIKKGRR